MNWKFVFLLMMVAIVGGLAPWIGKSKQMSQVIELISPHFQPSERTYQRAMPEGWLQANVASISGIVEYQGRYDIEFSPLTSEQNIGLGADIKTGSQSADTTIITFPNFAQITVNDNTRLTFSNTSADNFLIKVDRGGQINIASLTGQTSLSVRSLNLLAELTAPQATISAIEEIITIDLASGSATLGFNDLDYQTQIKEFTAPISIIFNDQTRKIKTEKLFLPTIIF